MTKKVLIIGLPGSGKTTLAKILKEKLDAEWINADKVRKKYNDWDFSKKGVLRQAKRMGNLASESKKKFTLVDFICPYEKGRKIFEPDFLIWMNTIKKGRLPTFDRSFEKPKTFDYSIKEKKDFKSHSTMIINKIMNKNTEIIAVVPVKLKSQRVKSKNLRRFADSNLFEIKINQLKKTKCFSKIIISSESDKILNIAKKNKLEVHKRDPYFSTSKVPMSEVYRNIASEVTGKFIAWVNITNPLITHRVYEKAVEKWKKIYTKHDCLLSSVEHKQNFYFKNKTINFKRTPWPRSQDLIPLVSLSFAINILKREDMIKWGSCVGKNPYFFTTDTLTATDIDDKVSFKLAEILYKKKKLLKKI